MMFDKHANLKYKFGNRHFGEEGYYVSTVGLNEATIKKYIPEQEKHDKGKGKIHTVMPLNVTCICEVTFQQQNQHRDRASQAAG